MFIKIQVVRNDGTIVTEDRINPRTKYNMDFGMVPIIDEDRTFALYGFDVLPYGYDGNYLENKEEKNDRTNS